MYVAVNDKTYIWPCLTIKTVFRLIFIKYKPGHIIANFNYRIYRTNQLAYFAFNRFFLSILN